MNKVFVKYLIRVVLLSAVSFFVVLAGGVATMVLAIKSLDSVEEVVEVGSQLITFSAYFVAGSILTIGSIYSFQRSKNR